MRTKTPLNIDRRPAPGSSWVIQNVLTNELCKCSVTLGIDKSCLGEVRKLFGAEPFFTVKIGSKYTKITYLKFFCGKHLAECLDEKNQWMWLDITQDEADIKRLWYSEPNLMTEFSDEEVPRLPETDFKPVKEIFNPWIEEWVNDKNDP